MTWWAWQWPSPRASGPGSHWWRWPGCGVTPGIGSALIAELERRLRVRGVRRIGALLAPGATGTTALENSGYRKVEEIAGVRSGPDADPGHGVTNELLKLIPGFRDHDDRLLICATNSVRSLDPAFLRPGRFDYVIPVGPPDPAARVSIWQRYLGPTADGVELHRLVAASEMFTPADIEFAARKGAHTAFEREVADRQDAPANTEDYLAAIADTRPTLTDQALTEFREDIEHYARM